MEIDVLNNLINNVQTLSELQSIKDKFNLLCRRKEIELSSNIQADIEIKNIFVFVDLLTTKMDEFNLTEKDVALGSGVSITTVKRCLRGININDKVNFPTVRIRDKIVNFLKEKEISANNLQ